VKPTQHLEHLTCPICNSGKIDPFIFAEDYFLSHEIFNIDFCKSCGLKFTNPRPSPDDLPRYYESEEYISHSNSQKGLINKIYQFVRRNTIQSKIRLIKNFVQSGNILDIGSGSGEFLNEIQKKDFITTGIEPNTNARKYAIDNFKLNILDETEINNLNTNCFNVITMWHVLEHVYDLDQRIKQIQSLLTENGILVVAVPNSASWDAKHYGKYWAAYDLPRHLYHFDQSTLIRLFQNYGFKLVNSKPMIFDSYYISLLSEKYRQGKRNYILGICNGFASNLNAWYSNGDYSSITYVFKYK
jgi:2-polyprenyl-3-methyl-5-hydroxy-6-metoxy-1,4-benzoquinol methylase